MYCRYSEAAPRWVNPFDKAMGVFEMVCRLVYGVLCNVSILQWVAYQTTICTSGFGYRSHVLSKH
jgi:hypothetical protein